jgi:hypothetical protein
MNPTLLRLWSMSRLVLLATCDQRGQQADRATTAPTAPAAASTAGEPPPSAVLPKACTLLGGADIERITGYGNATADSRELGSAGILENANSCTIVAGDGKFQVELLVGNVTIPPLPNRTTVELEGGAKGVVKDPGIGQQWMDEIAFQGYSVVISLTGPVVTLDADKKVAEVTRADGSTTTFEQVYAAIARAIAHNVATGATAAVPGGVSNVDTKADPCALLTQDEVQQAVPDFAVTDPESTPSAYGGSACRFRASSDALSTIVQIQLVYLTAAQWQAEQQRLGSNVQTSDIGDATAILHIGSGVALLQKGQQYVRVGLASTVNTPDSAVIDTIGKRLPDWLTTLAQRIAPRIP